MHTSFIKVPSIHLHLGNLTTAMKEERLERPLSHIEFRSRFCDVLKQRALGHDRRRFEIINSAPFKRARMSHLNPSLPPERLENLPHSLIRPTGAFKQRACRYCSYRRSLAKKNGEPLPQISRSVSYCKECNVHLHPQCMEAYHSTFVPANIVL